MIFRSYSTLFFIVCCPLWSSTLFPGGDPAALKVTTFATGLDFPTSAVDQSDTSILVGTTAPASGNSFTTYYEGTGSVLRFTDVNHDGVADNNSGTTVISGLSGAVSSIRSLGNGLVAVATTGTGSVSPNLFAGDIYLYREGALPTDPYTQVSDIHVQYASSEAAINMALASRPTQGSPGSFDLFFSLGSGTNDATPAPNVTLSGAVSASLPPGSIYAITVNANTHIPTLSQPVQVANGIRNSGGLTTDAAGNVYFDDNGYENGAIPVSTDELDLLSTGQIASGTPGFYGYPGNYTQVGTGIFVGGQGIPPLAAFQAAPGGFAPVGATEVALAPGTFPSGFNNGVFVGFHGAFASSGSANTQNPVLFYDFGTQTYYDFISAGLNGVGHLDGLLATPSALFVMDFNSGDGFVGGQGVIYEISAATPEPATWVLTLSALAIVLKRLRTRRRP